MTTHKKELRRIVASVIGKELRMAVRSETNATTRAFLSGFLRFARISDVITGAEHDAADYAVDRHYFHNPDVRFWTIPAGSTEHTE